MVRTYEITETPKGWKLTMYEDGEDVGQGVGGPDDYQWLTDQGEEFVGM